MVIRARAVPTSAVNTDSSGMGVSSYLCRHTLDTWGHVHRWASPKSILLAFDPHEWHADGFDEPGQGGVVERGALKLADQLVLLAVHLPLLTCTDLTVR